MTLLVTALCGCGWYTGGWSGGVLEASSPFLPGPIIQPTSWPSNLPPEVDLDGPLTPESAARIAVLNNPELKVAFQEVGIARADLIQAGLFENPDFDGEVRVTEGGEDAILEMSLTLDFMDIALTSLETRAARAELEQVRARLAGEILRVIGDVKRTYFRFQAAHQELELAQNAIETHDASFRMAEKLREAGNITELDVLKHRQAYERSRLELESAELEIVEARAELNRLLGIADLDQSWNLQTQIPTPLDFVAEEKDLLLTAMSESLDLKEAWFEVRNKALHLGITEIKAPIPELMIGVSTEREPMNEWSVGPTLGMEIPIFDAGQARIARKSAELQRAWARYRAVAVEVVAAVQILRERLETSANRSQHYSTTLLPLQDDILEQAHQRYNGMLIGVFDLLQTKREQIEMRRAYIREVRRYWAANADMEQLLSGKLPEPFGEEANKRARLKEESQMRSWERRMADAQEEH